MDFYQKKNKSCKNATYKKIKGQRSALACIGYALFFGIMTSASPFAISMAHASLVQSEEEKSGLLDIARKFMQRIPPKLEETRKKHEAQERASLDKDPIRRLQDGEDLLFSLHRNKLILSNNVFGMVENRSIYLSLSEFLYALDFPIVFDFEEKTAKGWFIREERNFLLDLNTGFIEANGNFIELQEKDYILREEESDIYLRADILGRAFGFDFDPDIKMLKMHIVGGDRLPVEDKIARQNRFDRLQRFDNTPELPLIEQEYDLISEPFVDVQLSSSYTKRQGNDPVNRANYSVITANDFAYGGLKTYISGDTDYAVSQARVTWTREAQEGENLFGEFDKIQLGDITPPRMRLFGGAGQELGVRLDNRVATSSLDETIDTTRFEGDIQPGWDVELYNNRILLELQTAGADGRYVFEDVPLNFGENNFRLVFYGPQGQIEETTQTILRGGNRLNVGQNTYSISLTNQGEITYRATDNTFRDSGTPNLITTFERGLNDNYSLLLGSRIHTVNDEKNAQLYTGLTGYFDSGIYDVVVGVETDGGAGIQATGLTKIAGQNIRFLHKSNTNDFDTPTPDGNNIISRTEATMQGRLTDEINYSQTLRHFMQDSKDNRYNYDASLGTRYGRGAYTLGYNWRYDEALAKDNTRQSASLSTNYNFSPFFLRGRANYSISPEMEFTGVSGSVLGRFSPQLSGQLDLDYLNRSGLTKIGGRLNYRTDYFTLSPNVTYDTDENLRAFVTMRFGVGRDPYSGQTVMTRENLTSLGGVSARAFLDTNNNGVWDPYEEAIPDVEIRSLQSSRRKRTDEHGIAFMPNLNEGNRTDIVLNTETLKDPYWLSAHEGNSIRPRPGKITRLDFPVVVSGEIDGVVNVLGKSGAFMPARRMPIHLVDMEGKVVNTTETAYDGFYVLDKIFPGTYKLMLDEKELMARDLLPVEPRGITFTPEGDVFFDQGFLTVAQDISPEGLQNFHEANPDKGVVLEIGRYNSKILMGVKLLSLKRNYGALIGDLQSFKGLVKQEKNIADNKYPLHLGPITDIEAANNTCNILRQFGEDCVIKSVQYDSQKSI